MERLQEWFMAGAELGAGVVGFLAVIGGVLTLAFIGFLILATPILIRDAIRDRRKKERG